jgi:hypothetical protein
MMTKRKRIVRDGMIVGYKTYKSGQGMFGTDIFEGYDWLKKPKKVR